MLERGRFLRPRRTKSHKRRGEQGGPLMLNIRLRRIAPPGTHTTNADVRNALQTLLDTGRMPYGWQFMVVNWKNPKRFGSDWESGWPARAVSDDPDEFIEAFRAVVQQEIRAARVRKL